MVAGAGIVMMLVSNVPGNGVKPFHERDGRFPGILPREYRGRWVPLSRFSSRLTAAGRRLLPLYSWIFRYREESAI